MNRMVFCLILLLLSINSHGNDKQCVVLLHGLARSASSMDNLQTALQQQGFMVANIDYNSRKKNIAQLAEIAVAQGIDQCQKQNAHGISFVTHSMGGILVRQYFKQHPQQQPKRVVMLGPPNQGSQVVDNLRNLPGFSLLNGPAGAQLGTGPNNLPGLLGAVNFDTGVIAGTRSINLILSSMLPNPDDGKVSLVNTKVQGMCGFISIKTSHPFLMKNKQAIEEVIHYLQYGRFRGQKTLPQCIIGAAKHSQ